MKPRWQEYIVDGIFPARHIHLLAGPSGAGKTRFLFQLLDDWQDGKDVLGHASHPAPFIYVAMDRPMDDYYRTLEAIGMDASRVPCLPAWDEGWHTMEDVMGHIETGIRLIVLENIAAFVGEDTDYHHVRDMLHRLSIQCQKWDVTIIGIKETPKQSAGNTYKNPKDRIGGTAAWQYHTGTAMIIEQEDPADPTNPNRTLYVMTRDSPDMRRLRFNEAGRLEDITDSGAEADSKLIMLDMWLASNAPTLFTLDEVQNIAKMTAIPKKTVDSWLRGCLKAGQLTSPRPGFYAKSPSQT